MKETVSITVTPVVDTLEGGIKAYNLLYIIGSRSELRVFLHPNPPGCRCETYKGKCDCPASSTVTSWTEGAGAATTSTEGAGRDPSKTSQGCGPG